MAISMEADMSTLLFNLDRSILIVIWGLDTNQSNEINPLKFVTADE